jgi:hypothetical protein
MLGNNRGMGEWVIFWSPEVLDYRKRDMADGRVYLTPEQRKVTADTLDVEGGALVFRVGGTITEVYGPGSYLNCRAGQ